MEWRILTSEGQMPDKDAFEAPEIAPGGAAEVDPADAVPGILVRIGGIALIMAGAMTIVSGAQLFAFFTLYSWVKAVPIVLGLVGAAAVGSGGYLFQGRGWAAWLSLAVGALQALVVVAWTLYALLATLFSPLFLLAAASSSLAAVLALVALPGALKADAARQALYA